MIQASTVTSLIGGAILGLSVALFVSLTGRISGISGIFEGIVCQEKTTFCWKAVYLAGLMTSSLYMAHVHPELYQPFGTRGGLPWYAFALAGFLVGMGTRLANGCTSGHGICGIARLAPRSIAATIIFMTAGIATASAMVSCANQKKF